MTQGKRIYELLADRGIPEREQKQVLKRITGVSYEGVRRWFVHNQDNIGAKSLLAIAEEFNCDLKWLSLRRTGHRATSRCAGDAP